MADSAGGQMLRKLPELRSKLIRRRALAHPRQEERPEAPMRPLCPHPLRIGMGQRQHLVVERTQSVSLAIRRRGHPVPASTRGTVHIAHGRNLSLLESSAETRLCLGHRGAMAISSPKSGCGRCTSKPGTGKIFLHQVSGRAAYGAPGAQEITRRPVVKNKPGRIVSRVSKPPVM